MGNRLCYSARRARPVGPSGAAWMPRRNTHLLRVWAEVFIVRPASTQADERARGTYCWQRMSDDVIPVNVLCLQQQPDFIYQVLAHDRCGVCVIDARIVQPGTSVLQPTECFVHFHDISTATEWGLNFTSAADARRFRLCCADTGLLRNGSASSLRSSPGPDTGEDHRKSAPCSPTSRRPASASEATPSRSSSRSSLASRASTPTRRHDAPPLAVANPYDRYKTYRTLQPIRNDPPERARRVEIHLDNCTEPRRTRRRSRAASANDEPHDTECTCSVLERLQPADADNNATTPRSIMRRANNNCRHDPQRFSTRIDSHNCSLAPLTCDTQRPHVVLHSSSVCSSLARSGAQKLRNDSDSGCVVTATELSSGSSNATQCNAKMARAAAPSSTSLTFSLPSGRRNSAGTPRARQLSTNDAATDWPLPIAQDDLDSQLQLHLEMQLGAFAPTSFSDLNRIDEQLPLGADAKPKLVAHTHAHAHESFVFASLQEGVQAQGERERTRDGVRSSVFNTDLDAVELRDGVLTALDAQTGATGASVSSCSHSSTVTVSSSVCVTSDGDGDGDGDGDSVDQLGGKGPDAPVEQAEVEPQVAVALNANAGATSNSNSYSPAASDREQRARQRSADLDLERKITNPALASTSTSRWRGKQLASHVRTMSNAAIVNSCAAPREETATTDASRCMPAVCSAKSRRKLRKTHERQPAHRLPCIAAGRDRERDLPFVDQDSDTHAMQSLYDAEDEDGDGDGYDGVLPRGAPLDNDRDSESSISTMTQHELADATALSDRLGGAVRKSDWLFAKKWLVHTLANANVEFARTRTWKRYFVVLRGSALLFFCDASKALCKDSIPSHVILIDGAIAVALSEFQTRENVFALGTAFGEAYLFQTGDWDSLCEWIDALHVAAACQFARQLGTEALVSVLKSELKRLESHIDLDNKMKKLNEMQLSASSDKHDSRRAASKQMTAWEENIERLTLEAYRCTSYMSALHQSTAKQRTPAEKLLNLDQKLTASLLHPRSDVLAAAHCAALTACSKLTQSQLQHVGTCNVVTMYTCVSARAPLTTVLLKKRTKSVINAKTAIKPGSSSNGATLETTPSGSGLIVVQLPSGTCTTVPMRTAMNVHDVLTVCCKLNGISVADHFLRLHLVDQGMDLIPDPAALLQCTDFHKVEICRKVLFSCCVSPQQHSETPTSSLPSDAILRRYGFSIASEIVEEKARVSDSEGSPCGDPSAPLDRKLTLHVQQVTHSSGAEEAGLAIGDEILNINGKAVADLDMVYVEHSILHAEGCNLLLILKSCRATVPPKASRISPTDYALSLITLASDLMSERRETSCQHSLTPLSPPLVTSTDDEGDKTVTASPRYQSAPVRQSPSALRSCLANQVSSAESDGSHLNRNRLEPPVSAQFDASANNCVPLKQCADCNDANAQKRMHMHMHKHKSSSNSYPSTIKNVLASVDDLKADGSTKSSSSNSSNASSKLSNVDKIRKCIAELIDTELSYVKDLGYLQAEFIKPLRYELFWENKDMQHLHETLCAILRFQEPFCNTLQLIRQAHPFEAIQTVEQFSVVLSAVADTFLHNAERFKLYGSFTAVHSRVLCVLNEERVRLRRFLQSHATVSTQHQHCHVLESYLIKPVQRIVKYPLLLKQLGKLCSESCVNVASLCKALSRMETVAEHINEMQKIHEDFGEIFEHIWQLYASGVPRLLAYGGGGGAGARECEYVQQHVRVPDLNLSELQMYGTVEWLNMSDYLPLPLGRKKHADQISTYCFVFRCGVVILCIELQRTKAKQSLRASSSSLQLDRKATRKTVTRIVRYQTWIPADELQVRMNANGTSPIITATEGSYPWQLIHLRPLAASMPAAPSPASAFARPVNSCSTGGFQELAYLLVNCSQTARNDFLRIVRHVIRCSTRKLNFLPSSSNAPAVDLNMTRSAAPERQSVLFSAAENANQARCSTAFAYASSADDSLVNYQLNNGRFLTSTACRSQIVFKSAGSGPAASQGALASYAGSRRCLVDCADGSSTPATVAGDHDQNHAVHRAKRLNRLALAPLDSSRMESGKRSPVWQPRSEATYDSTPLYGRRSELGAAHSAYSLDYSPYAVTNRKPVALFNLDVERDRQRDTQVISVLQQGSSQPSSQNTDKFKASTEYSLTSHV